MLKESILDRSPSMTNTEVSSLACESEREMLESSLMFQQLKLGKSADISTTCTSSTSRTSSSFLDLSEAEIELLSKSLAKEQRGILVVRTQEESIRQSLDERLASGRRLAAVSFGKLHIREYALRPGDNPGCRVGASLTIDWAHGEEMSVDLEAYEGSRPPRREQGELNIPATKRMEMLRESGYSRSEIQSYVKMANIARSQRSRTNEIAHLAAAEEFAQRVVRGVLNSSVLRSKKKKEKELIKASVVKDQQLLQLRWQLNPAEDRWQRKGSSSSEETASVPEQAPVAPRRWGKRDSLDCIGPVLQEQPEGEDEPASETSTNDDDEEDWTPCAQEMEC